VSGLFDQGVERLVQCFRLLVCGSFHRLFVLEVAPSHKLSDRL
jgi:hypothetical protein